MGTERGENNCARDVNVWELRFLQSIYQWFDGSAYPIEENYEALSKLLCGNSFT